MTVTDRKGSTKGKSTGKFCEWKSTGLSFIAGCGNHSMWDKKHVFCPACGRKVKVSK